ncbi:MAG: hypothetical protein AAF570_26375, partial [Bacteroidota bacterium]
EFRTEKIIETDTTTGVQYIEEDKGVAHFGDTIRTAFTLKLPLELYLLAPKYKMGVYASGALNASSLLERKWAVPFEFGMVFTLPNKEKDAPAATLLPFFRFADLRKPNKSAESEEEVKRNWRIGLKFKVPINLKAG